MFENKRQPLLSKVAYRRRFIKFSLISVLILGISLLIGMLGYHFLEKISWIDSFYNASMILTGMGPVNHLTDDGAKIFSSVYALYSGVAFLVMIGVLFAPAFHRFFHKLHVDMDDPGR